VDTPHHFCPSLCCAYYGWVGLGNVRANGHPSGGRWRQLQCVACGTYVLETHGTPLHGKRVAPELVVWAVGALAEGLGIHAVVRMFEVDPNTVLQWLVEAADHAAVLSRYFCNSMRSLNVPGSLPSALQMTYFISPGAFRTISHFARRESRLPPRPVSHWPSGSQ
jgi:hypothetical protein